jgi:urea carboxylase-associated protein 2
MSLPNPRPLLSETLRGGQMWSRIVRRGQVLRLTDVEGGATPAALFFNAVQPLERYNAPDTLKAQHTARLTLGNVLLSDMGRVLMSVVSDSAGWHDTITGHMDRRATEDKYGSGRYQALRNDFYRDTRSNFLVELGKYGLGKRELVPNVNFFVKVTADERGELRWCPTARAGQFVELRAEMDVLVVLSNTPHPLDPSEFYRPKPLDLGLYQARTVEPDDVCRTHCDENTRAFELTEKYHL